jgi:hypothetical protein
LSPEAPVTPPKARATRVLWLLAVAALAALSAHAGNDSGDFNLQDYIAPPGTKQSMKTSMLHADLSKGYDRRVPLDTVVYALENGSRCCRLIGRDSAWVVDYTWVYPHRGMPKRWYDAEDLIRVGDSLRLGDDAEVVVTFGTYRLGVHAGSYEQASSEAKRLRPKTMPTALAGRLKLKLERAEKALNEAGGSGSEKKP